MYALLLALGALALAWLLWHRPPPPPAVLTRVAGIRDTIAGEQASIARNRLAAVTDTAHAAAAARRADSATTGSAVWRRMADSLAGAARARGDSALLWRAAYEARTQEADSLRLANVELTMAVSDAQAANRRLLTSVLDSANAVIAHHEAIEAVQAAALAAATAPCRLLGPIPCPTRGQAFAGGFLLTELAHLAARR